MMENVVLSEFDFTQLSSFINQHFGIQLSESKRVMMQARLIKVLQRRSIRSFREYRQLVLSKPLLSPEVMELVNVMSTNKTDFYREPAHFQFLANHILPEYLSKKSRKDFKVWSSACSSGEEVYTSLFVINEFMKTTRPFEFNVLGTDISTDILDKSINGIYTNDRIDVVPENQKRHYFLKSRNEVSDLVRVIPQIRSKAQFKRLNLMDTVYDVPREFDVIFCRNVLIYFEKHIQERVIRNLCSHLKNGGYLMIGHSESLNGFQGLPLEQVVPTIYKKI